MPFRNYLNANRKYSILILFLAITLSTFSQAAKDTNFGKKPGIYCFEPSVSVVTGKLKVEMYYGPPNYGESPSTDSKEYSYILYPDSVINVIQKDSNGNSADKTIENVKKFQLAQMGEVKLHPFVNKRIRVTGEFFGAITGHHHTDVLMSVEKAEELK